MSSVIITEERKESYYFSDPYASGSALFIIRKENAPGVYNHLRELDGKTIGTLRGSIHDIDVREAFVDPDLEYYDSASAILDAVLTGDIDAGISTGTLAAEMLSENSGLVSIGSIGSEDIAFAFGKNDSGSFLKAQLDEYILKLKESGALEDYENKWFVNSEGRDVDYESPEDINGTLKVAVSTGVGKPSCYRDGDRIIGFDIDILTGFAKAYGYALETVDYAFSDMLRAVSNGSCDIGASSITVTEERTEFLQFSEPYYEGQILVVVKEQASSVVSHGFFSTLKNKINRTLIEEDRYKLYLSGIITTCVISLVSAVAGLALGYLLFLLFKSNRKITNRLLRVYQWTFDALPVVVILMIFYYVIFGNSKISGVWVSVIAFTVIFSVSVFGLLKTCFMSVDNGQYEAAYALGYSKRETLHSIIIPQVLPVFLPPFKSEFMSLLKATSIVGYISVQDITKISDIIRSRTYEAFFPLVITTVIYFLITALFTLLTKRLEKLFDPKTRDIDEILKGAR